MQTIHIERIFPLPPAELFAELTHHERFGEIMGQNILTLKAAEGEASCGVGSVRQIPLGIGLTFEETVRSYVPGQLMEYQVTRGSPVTEHWGRMAFHPHPRGCRLLYSIRFQPRIPFTGGLIAVALRRALTRGLDRYRDRLPLRD
ncbi:SRPBCC family protein [Simiduia agarivorans]|uniref:Uncharacterized protein n=1 Tax=Simiduia agarivorans (strain DSM 21679 / JCM 13881 / BCRC 17597 / SA1) TaxID=1117647 RepID=K4KLK5_SIMAS|nr:SRPBCC family protein [Simiduia agarivorans]AFU99105.1 hypothetical protein M5M_09600 [Simiduia agarivorans SA1 = DSM 21679]